MVYRVDYEVVAEQKRIICAICGKKIYSSMIKATFLPEMHTQQLRILIFIFSEIYRSFSIFPVQGKPISTFVLVFVYPLKAQRLWWLIFSYENV